MLGQAQKRRAPLAHGGHEVVGVYSDGGVSGTVPFGERPEGRRLLVERVKLGTQLVVALKTDRIGRSLFEILRIHQEMEKLGVILRALDAPADTTTPEGRMMLHITGAFAEHERNRIIDRTKTALARCTGRALSPVASRGTKPPWQASTTAPGSPRRTARLQGMSASVRWIWCA